MPRIPVYQQRVNFQMPNVQTVQLATPLKEAATSTKTIIAEQYDEVKTQYEDMAMKRSQAAATEAEQGRKEADAMHKNQLLFSSPDRQEILNYASSEVFVPSGERNLSAQRPTQRLDHYFASLHTTYDGSQDLLSQDYAVLRNELSRAEGKAFKQQREQAFNTAGESFVKMSGLIQTPQALREYISTNLQNASDEGKSLGLDEVRAQAQRQHMKDAAVSSSVENSLAAGEVSAAESVFNQFQAELSEPIQELLYGKLQSKASQLLAQELFNEAKGKYGQGLDRWDEEEAEKFINESLSKQDEQTRQEVESFLKLERSREKQAVNRLQSQYYAQLRGEFGRYGQQGIGYDKAESLLMRGYCLDREDFSKKQEIVKELYARPEAVSSSLSFNKIYQEMLSADSSDKTLEKAFKKKEINAEDYLLLKSQYFGSCAGEKRLEEKLLMQSVESFCRKEKLSSSQTEDVKYAIFSVPGGAAEKIQAAKTIKEIFSL